jgi:hypothetical protein
MIGWNTPGNQGDAPCHPLTEIRLVRVIHRERLETGVIVTGFAAHIPVSRLGIRCKIGCPTRSNKISLRIFLIMTIGTVSLDTVRIMAGCACGVGMGVGL